MPVNLENSPVAKQDWKRSVFIPMSKNGNDNECSNYCIIVLVSHASKIMLKILQASLQQYMSWEPPDVQADLEKAEAPEIKLATLLDHRESKTVSRNLLLPHWLR